MSNWLLRVLEEWRLTSTDSILVLEGLVAGSWC